MQTSNTTQIQELLLHIGSSHDENGSKYAVKRLAELLGQHDAQHWGRQSLGPAGSEASWPSTQLLRLWDSGVAKNATPHYVENCCRIFRHLGLSDELIHQKRVRIVHSLLSSGNRTKVSCGLLLLKDVADGKSRSIHENTSSSRNGPSLILDSVDFSLGALGTVGVPPKVTGGRLMNATARDQDGAYARGLWNSRDLSKAPTRVAYVALWISMVQACDAQTLAKVLSLREFMGSVLNYVSRDPWSVQQEVLRVVKTCVLELDDVVMTPVTKWGAFGEGRFFGQLAHIVEQACTRLQEDGVDIANEDRVGGEGETDTELGVVRRVLAMASELLTDVVSLMGGMGTAGVSANGSLNVKNTYCSNEFPDVSGPLAVATIPQQAVKPLMGLRPTRCYEHARAIHRAFERNPLIAGVYLRDLNLEVDMKKEATFLVNASLLVGAYGALTRYLGEIKSQTSRAGYSPRRIPSEDLVSMWKAVFPTKGMSKAALSKGLQHSQPLVGHASVLLLDAMLETLEHVVACLEMNQERLGSTCSSALSRVLDHSKKYLPGVQLIIGYHAKIEFDGMHERVASHTLSGILSLLKRWAHLFPDAFIEENVQLERMLLHERVLGLHPSNRLQVVQVLLGADEGGSEPGGETLEKSRWASTIPRSSSYGLDVILKLALREASPGSKMYHACSTLAKRYLSSTQLLFKPSNSTTTSAASQAAIWTRHASLHGVATDAVVDFFIEALKMTIKKPMAYIDMAETCSSRFSHNEYVSPLLTCSIEKMCRILKSRARDDEYKAAIVRFVRGVLEDTMADSLTPDMYFVLLKHMIDTEFPGIEPVEVGSTEIPSKTKRSRREGQLGEAVRLALIDATRLSDPSIIQWVVQSYENGVSSMSRDTDREAGQKDGSTAGKKTRVFDEKRHFCGDINNISRVSELLHALENAKKAPSKYHRRLQLAAMISPLEALLARPLSSGDMCTVCDAFAEPIIQYFGSKDVQVPLDADVGDAVHFTSLRGLSTETIVRLLTGRTDGGSHPSDGSSGVEASTIQLAEPLLLVKGRKNGGSTYCNASALDKLRVLRAVVVSLTTSLSSFSSSPMPSDNLARFACRVAIAAIPFTRDGGSGRQLAMELIESVGDIISDLGASARQLGEFDDLLRLWSTTFVPSALGGSGQSMELTRCLRRFSASLIPDDDDVPFVGGERRTAAMYDEVCSLFLELITQQFVQDTLRVDEPPTLPPAYLCNRMPLVSIVACASGGTMMRNSFSYREADADSQGRHKVEMCEIIETLLEIITLLERDAPSQAVAGYATKFDTAELVLMRYLMATYGASLSQADIATWSLIRMINGRLWKRRRSGGLGTSNTASSIETTAATDEMMLALMLGPVACELNYNWGVNGDTRDPLEDVSPLRCAMTVVDFPEWRHLVDVDRLPDSVDRTDAPQEHFMSYEASGYDPAFFLPMCLFSLRTRKNKDVLQQVLIDSAALPLILRCLGSADTWMRAAAYECLALIEQDTPPLFEERRREVSRLRLLLDWVRQSTIAPFHRFPSVHAVFAAEVSHALFRPACDAYPITTKHLCKYAAMDLKRIILTGSKGSQHGWMHRLLICGLRSSSDVYLYTKAHVFELNMALAASKQQRHRELAILLLHQGSSIPKAARVMAEACGAFGWLSQVIANERKRCDHADDIEALSLLERAWQHMTSWKGILERGSERCRETARCELAIARTRLL